MKTAIRFYTIIFCGGLFFLCPQLAAAQRLHQEDVPTALQETFTVMHPELKLLYWEKIGSNYKAFYRGGKEKGSLLFDDYGNLLGSESEISTEELPKAVRDAVSKQSETVKIRGAGKIEGAKGKLQYEVQTDDYNYILDPAGKLLEKSKAE